jgi:anti-anti-sigma factor
MTCHAPTSPASSPPHIAFDFNDDLHPQMVIVEFLTHAFADPTHTAQLGQQLDSLIQPDLPHRFVLDFEDVRAFSSAAFGALVSFILNVRHAGGQVAICNMDEFVRAGADAIHLGEYADFAADRQSGIERFLEG